MGNCGALGVQPDDEICLCFHVTQRKLLSFIRVEQPRRASQLSECSDAGTGCGWCRPFLRQLFAQAADEQPAAAIAVPVAEEYARLRQEYIQEGKGTPPAESTHGP